MISFELVRDEGLVIIEPSSPLEEGDFEKLAAAADAFIDEKGPINGLIINTPSFPGWENFAAFVKHVKFVKDHHRSIKRVAAVTDSAFVSIVPVLSKLFISAEFRHFDYGEMDSARRWIGEGK